MKYLILLLLVASCKQTKPQVVQVDHQTIAYKNATEDYEGRFYLENAGLLEMYNDYNNQITILSTTIYFTNPNGSLANFIIPAFSKLEVSNGRIITPIQIMTGANASVFWSNVDGNPSGSLQLPAAGTFRYYLIFEDGDRMTLNIMIQQLIGGSYTTVVNNKAREI